MSEALKTQISAYVKTNILKSISGNGLRDLMIDMVDEYDAHIEDSIIHIIAGERSNWDDAYGWGNHALAGYLTSLSFLGLTDTPAAYTGAGLKGIRVKATVDGVEFYTIVDTDEKVKYDAGDPTAGYIADKFRAGDGISVAEGTGANENKLVITNSDKGSDVVVPINSDFSLVGLSDVDDTDIGVGKIIKVGADGVTHEYITYDGSKWEYEIYDDWFLPSKDEFQAIVDAGTVALSPDDTKLYMTSSESSLNSFWCYTMIGSPVYAWNTLAKGVIGYIIPVRTFTIYEAVYSIAIGATGQAGKVFYRTNDGTISTYYESLIVPIDEVAWASPGMTATLINANGTAIGTGVTNTAIILAADPIAPGALACDEHEVEDNYNYVKPIEVGGINPKVKIENIYPITSEDTLTDTSIFAFLKVGLWKNITWANIETALVTAFTSIFTPILSSPVDYYINCVTGDDANAGTNVSPFEHTNYALSLLPKNLGNNLVTIYWQDSLAYDEAIVVNGFYNGTILFKPQNDPVDVLLSNTSSADVININNCSAFIEFLTPNIKSVGEGGTGILAQLGSNVYVYSCKFADSGNTSSFAIMALTGSNVRVYNAQNYNTDKPAIGLWADNAIITDMGSNTGLGDTYSNVLNGGQILATGRTSGTNTGDQASSDFDHDSLTNTHNLTTDVDHDNITNTHNLTTDIDHNSITNTHNLTTDIDHDSITNTHNLTTDIDHDSLTNTHNLTSDIIESMLLTTYTENNLGNSGGTKTVPMNTHNFHRLTLTADCTLTLTAPSASICGRWQLTLIQDGTGEWDCIFPTGVGGVVFPQGAFVFTTGTANQVCIVSMEWNGTYWVACPTDWFDVPS